MCKFRNVRSAFRKFTCGSSVIHDTMRNKKVKLNSFIVYLNSPVLRYEISVNTHHSSIQNSRLLIHHRKFQRK